MNKYIIEVKELSKHYGEVYAVRGVSFSVYPGDILGILGQIMQVKQRLSR